MKHYVVLFVKVLINLLLAAGLDFSLKCGLMTGFTLSYVVTEMLITAEFNRRTDIHQEAIMTMYSNLLNPPEDIRKRL